MLKVLDSAVPVACWSCAISHNDSTLFCPHCSKIQPPPGGDYFSVFGLKPRLNLDLHALEHEFHRLSRRLHPDHFSQAAENEKEWSLADSAFLNDAYRTLKDPLRRTQYLLKLVGHKDTTSAGVQPSGVESAADRKDTSRVPPDMLEEVFDLNMQLEEMRLARENGDVDAELQAQVTKAKAKFTGLVEEVDRDLLAEWKAWDMGDASARFDAQAMMMSLLDRRRYLSNLVRDISKILEA
jgi:molecular chaperone HscB